jgi:CRP/FNR family transcriptional activator FtrB
MRPSDHIEVRALPLFRNMPDESFAGLVKHALLQRFPAHADIIKEGDPPDFLYVVVDGAVDLFATRDGHDSTIDIIGPASTFILAAVIRDELYLKSARTLMPSKILMIPAAAVRDAFTRDAQFARDIVMELAARYRAVTRTLKGDRLRTSAERLANWILRLARQADGKVIELPLEKRRLASYLGMTPESYSRSLALLETHGVHREGSSIRVTDPERLREFAKPTLLESD